MNARPPASPPLAKKPQTDPRKDRLAKALKQNLRRRKAAAAPRS